MKRLQQVVDEACAHGVPGAVALIARPDEVRVATAGERAIGGEPMSRDTVFRIASLTKPILAAATLVLVDRGVLALDDPIERWLPELASPRVLRDPAGPLDETVAAERPITVEHLLTLTGGHGLTTVDATPLGAALTEHLHQGPPDPQAPPAADDWLARLAQLPLAHQPGDGWSYNTGADVLGVLLARATGTTLGAVLAETVFDPLGMTDTGFVLSADQQSRAATSYRRAPGADSEGPAAVEVVDRPDGGWARPAVFESGAGGLVSTADDLLAFARMLLAGGARPGGGRLLAEESVSVMMSARVRDDSPFLDGQAWGYGGGVDVVEQHPMNVPGRYGWVGGTGTALYVYPQAGLAAVWLTQLELGGPDDSAFMEVFLTDAAITARQMTVG